MPEIRNYTVTQVREVKITANTPLEAAELADKAFKGEEIDPSPGSASRVRAPIRERDLNVRELY